MAISKLVSFVFCVSALIGAAAFAFETSIPVPDGRPPNPNLPEDRTPLPTPPAGKGEHVRLRNTYYYVVLEKLYEREPKTAAILDMKGNVLVQVSRRFKSAVDIEGTGRLLDGRVINYAGVVDKQIRYMFTDAPFGLGVGSCRLRPFKTIAVDPRVVPLGSTVYIAETDGMRLPDGGRHSGVWRAHDIGGAIKRDRVDLFVGDGDRGDILTAAGITNLKALNVTILTGVKPDSCVHAARP